MSGNPRTVLTSRSDTWLNVDEASTAGIRSSPEKGRNGVAFVQKNHLASIHQHRKQDGLIFVGSEGHDGLLKYITDVVPSLLRSNYPLFMPISYQNDIKLRLDSNIFFFRGNHRNYDLYDVFAVKVGPSIELEVGKWTVDNGISLVKSSAENKKIISKRECGISSFLEEATKNDTVKFA